MLAVLYRRVSTDHQDNSLEVQEALNNTYCTRMGLPTAAQDYADPDTSGSIPFREREGGRALLARLQHGDITDLVTARQDRLGRDTMDAIATIRHIWGLGIVPHFTAEGGAYPRTPQNELLFEIKASVAQYERNLIRERTRTTLRQKFAKGELIGKVPYGYDCVYTFADGATHISPRALCWGGPQRTPESLAAHLAAAHGTVVGKRLVPNPPEQATLREMAAWRAGGQTLEAIAQALNATGRRPKLGGQWQAGNVDGVLKSRHTAALLSREVGTLAPTA